MDRYYPRGSKLTIIDASDGMVAEMERKLRLRKRGDVIFGRMDASKLEFPDKSFDTVVSR